MKPLAHIALLLCLVGHLHAGVTKTLTDGNFTLVDGVMRTSLSPAAGFTDPDNPLILYQWDISQTNLTGFDNVGSLAGLDAEIDLGSSSDPDRLFSNGVWFIKLDGTDFTTTKGFPAAITGLPTYTISWWIRFAVDPQANQAVWSWTTNVAGFATFHEGLADSVGGKEQLKAVLTHNTVNQYSMETPSATNIGQALNVAYGEWALFTIVQPNDGGGLQYFANGATNVNGFTVSTDKDAGMREIFNATLPVSRLTIGGLMSDSLQIPIAADIGSWRMHGTNLNITSITNLFLNTRTNEVIR